MRRNAQLYCNSGSINASWFQWKKEDQDLSNPLVSQCSYMSNMRWRRCLVMLLICLRLCTADDCTPEQCASMLPDLKSCVDIASFGGGDNWIAFCKNRSSKFAVRFSVVQDLATVHKAPNMYFQSLNFGRALCGSQSPIVPKLRRVIQGTWRRALSMSEYYDEIRLAR